MHLSGAGVSFKFRDTEYVTVSLNPFFFRVYSGKFGHIYFWFLPDDNASKYPTKVLVRAVISVNINSQPLYIPALPHSLLWNFSCFSSSLDFLILA